MESPVFDRNKDLEQQITLLQLKKEHIENLIDLARGIKMIGVKRLDFKAFDTKKMDDYARQAKQIRGTTEILKGLGDMYSGGGSMTENIDKTRGCYIKQFRVFSFI